MYRRCLRVSFACFVLVPVAACDADDSAGPEPEARAGLSAEPAFEGRLVMRIADYHDGTSRTFFVLKAEGAAIEVEVPEGIEIERGALVRAWGDIDSDGVLHVGAHEVVEPAPTKEREIDAEPKKPRRVAFVSLTWAGGGPGLPQQEGESKVFTGSTSTNNYYQEVSYGREKIVGMAFGPYEIEKPEECGGIGTESIGLAARRAVKEEYPTAEAEFTQFMYHFPHWNSCEWAGLAEVGTPDDPQRDTWYNNASGCVVLAQELGHNYGMRHSHSYDCQDGGQDVPYSDDCTFAEYGHPFDPMGGGCGHMNQVQKGYMDWLGGCNQVTATADGTFNLMPTELPCDGHQSLRFLTGNVDDDDNPLYYYLEYRRPLGQFDDPGPQWGSGLSGVLVHVGTELDANTFESMGLDYTYGPTNYILDMPGQGWFMHEGESYADHDGVVTFSVLEENDTHAVIQAEFPGGGSGEPTCLDDSVPEKEGGNYGTLDCAAGPIEPDLTAPTVAITYPQDGDVFPKGSSFDILVDAQDDRGVADVLLYVNGEPQYKDFEAPYSWAVSGVPVGTYELGAVASDGPNWTPSEAIYITVGEEEEEPEETGSDDTGSDDGGMSDETDTEDGGAGDAGADEGGCGCRNERGSPAGLAFALLALGAGRRWRRRTARLG